MEVIVPTFGSEEGRLELAPERGFGCRMWAWGEIKCNNPAFTTRKTEKLCVAGAS